MNLPIRLIKFWYPNALEVFIRTWHNLMNLLEEDLAVGLMLKLLFVPLFHDSSFVGKGLSFLFRSARIFTGLVAFALMTVSLLILALIWFTGPIGFIIALFLYSQFALILFGAFLFLGIALFIQHLIIHQPKKVWHVKAVNEIWEATRLKKDKIIFEELTQTLEVQNLLQSLEILPDHFSVLKPPLSDHALETALKLAQQNQADEITSDYFWVGLLLQAPQLEQFLLTVNLTWSDLEQALGFQEHKRKSWRRVMIWDEDFSVKHLKGTNRGWLSAPTPILDSVSTDLTKVAAKEGYDQFLGREATVTQVINILSQSSDRNVLIVGEAGSGRSTLVKHLARLIIAGDAPPALATKRLVELDLTKLMSGVNSEGDLAMKVKGAFEEVEFIQDAIIYVDELQNLGQGDVAANFNLYSLMLPYLESNKFQFLASTDLGNYARIIEKNGSFARLFHKVELPAASQKEAMEIIENKAIDLIRHQKIILTFLAIKVLVHYSSQLIHDRVLPDSALMILSECLALAKNGLLDSNIVKQVLQARIKVPILEIDQSQKDLLLDLEQVIHQKMIDQQEAVKAVADTLRRASTSLREENRPIGSFLFVGPTGVGKTELAKILAETYFKNQGAFEHFDMSEYQTDQAVDRLLGTTGTPGELTETIKNKPYSLLLLDEFEKASPRILTLFLQVLEEGRLTDYSGHQVDFSNTIIIATSNAASLIIAEGLQQGKILDKIAPAVKAELLKIYKPELINRFDQVVIFKPLTPEDLQKIVQIKLYILQQLLKQQGYLVDFAPEVVSELVQKGFDPVLGARPMRRLIQDTLEANLSKLILSNQLVKGQKFIVH